MKKLAALVVLGLLVCGSVSADGTSGLRQAANAALPGELGIGVAASPHTEGIASGLALNGLYRLPTEAQYWPRYLDLMFEQMSDTEVDLKNIARAELFWEPLADSTFGFVIGGGGAAQNFGIENTEWGFHYGIGCTIKLSAESRLMLTFKDNDLHPANATVGAAYVIELGSF